MESQIVKSRVILNNQKRTKTAVLTPAFWEAAEFNRFGITVIMLLVIGCVGGIAAGFGAMSNILLISLVAFPTIISLALVLAVAPMRVIFFSASLAIVCDVIALLLG